MMPFDRSFWDEANGKYTVDAYLDALTTQYGGIDSVLLWPTYTNIGADSRNQFQMISSMPLGIEAAVAELHRRGVKVLFPYSKCRRACYSPLRGLNLTIPDTNKGGTNYIEW